MATFYGMKKLAGPDSWEGLAGDGRWKATRSAYELAYAWHGPNGIPKAMSAIFDESGIAELAKLTLDIGFVEKPTFLDTPVGPSMTDIMGYAHNAEKSPVILAVEGKATEPFGSPVKVWLRGPEIATNPSAEVKPSRARRLKYLGERLGLRIDENSELYYQLLHRTVAGLTEALLGGASCAVLVIHSFAPNDADPNWDAYKAFIEAIGAPAPTKNAVSGPIALSGAQGTRLYALWYQDKPRA